MPLSVIASDQPSRSSSAPIASGQVVAAARPDIGAEPVEDERLGLVEQLLGRPSAAGAGRDPDVDGVRPGVGRDLRIRPAQGRLAEQVGDL